jgi:hypothetical protein
MYSFVSRNGLTINEAFLEFLKRYNLADYQTLMHLGGGSTFKKTDIRSVVKIDIGEGDTGKSFYLKRHRWPWRLKIKAIRERLKKEDARNEWEKMIVLHSLGFKTMTPVAFGEKRMAGIPCSALTLTETIEGAEKLESYIPRHFTLPLTRGKVLEKRALIGKLASLAREFHGKNLNHQDFYFSHLLIRESDGAIFIVDIQRVHGADTVSMHDRIKDIAQIAFSSSLSGIFTRSDFMRFIHVYLAKDRLGTAEKRMIRKIHAKVKKIARHTEKIMGRRMVS